MHGFKWKRNADEIIERRRRFFGREMQDSILVTLPIERDVEAQWQAFEKKWGTYKNGDKRPLPSNEEIFERLVIGLAQRKAVEDDWLPVVYSVLDIAGGIAAGTFGGEMTFIHRQRDDATSKSETVLMDYSMLEGLSFSMEHPWAERFFSIQDYFRENADGKFAQNPSMTMDALNFAVDIRSATEAYIDIYIQPDKLKKLMEIGLEFNIQFQEAQRRRAGRLYEGCFEWLGGWVPFPDAVTLSVDAYVICSVENYIECGFEYQQQLIDHFGHGLMHFHCNRTDLAAEVIKLKGLELFQFGNDTRDSLTSFERLPEMRKVAGDIPIMVGCRTDQFSQGLKEKTLLPNVWYRVHGRKLKIDEANRIMDKVRTYRS